MTYYGKDWRQIRDEVIEDDGCKCSICLSNEDLEVHHIEPIKMFDEPEKANSRDNLATLCQRCHSRVESIQDPHTRRGLDSFMAELDFEDVDVPSSLITFFCHGEPTTSCSEASVCSTEGCFYPVKDRDWKCFECGRMVI